MILLFLCFFLLLNKYKWNGHENQSSRTAHLAFRSSQSLPLVDGIALLVLEKAAFMAIPRALNSDSAM